MQTTDDFVAWAKNFLLYYQTEVPKDTLDLIIQDTAEALHEAHNQAVALCVNDAIDLRDQWRSRYPVAYAAAVDVINTLSKRIVYGWRWTKRVRVEE